VILRSLPDDDALFGVDFTPQPHHHNYRSEQPVTMTEFTAAVTTAPAEGIPSLLHYLTRVLKTPAIGHCWEELADHARDENWSHEEYLAAVLQRQVSDRESKGTAMRIATAHFRR
jgi:hypothetical protein